MALYLLAKAKHVGSQLCKMGIYVYCLWPFKALRQFLERVLILALVAMKSESMEAVSLRGPVCRGDWMLRLLVFALKGNHNVKKLTLDNTGFGDHHAKALSKVVACNGTLEHVYIHDTSLTGPAILEMFESLGFQQKVRHFSLQNPKGAIFSQEMQGIISELMNDERFVYLDKITCNNLGTIAQRNER